MLIYPGGEQLLWVEVTNPTVILHFWWHNSTFIMNSDNRSINRGRCLLCLQVEPATTMSKMLNDIMQSLCQLTAITHDIWGWRWVSERCPVFVQQRLLKNDSRLWTSFPCDTTTDHNGCIHFRSQRLKYYCTQYTYGSFSMLFLQLIYKKTTNVAIYTNRKWRNKTLIKLHL